MELSGEQTIGSRGVCEPGLEPRCEWEGSRTRDQDFKPDLGNSAVRHYRGGLRKRSPGGNEIPTRNRKSGLGNPSPTAGASEFYPNQNPLMHYERAPLFRRLRPDVAARALRRNLRVSVGETVDLTADKTSPGARDGSDSKLPVPKSRKKPDRPRPGTVTMFSTQTRRSSPTSCEETEIENDFQKKCRKGAKFAAHTAFSAILGKISCLFSLALEFFTRFRGGSFQPLTHLSGKQL